MSLRRAVVRSGVLSLAVALWGGAVLPVSHAGAASVVAIAVATDLNDPTAFTFAADGRIVYAERSTGQIRILDPAAGTNELYFTVPRVAAGDGIVGLALHPRFPAKPFVYAFGSRMIHGVETDQLLRIRGSSSVGSSMRVLLSFDAGTIAPAHHGGRLLFGPDRMLYLMVGDAGVPANAQDLGLPYGKVLRLTSAGAVPADNPTPGSPVYASGLRNSIGMTFDPRTGALWESDNGPECNDEINVVHAGGNYGWGPTETCATPPPPPANTNQDGPDPIQPVSWFDTPVAPTGVTFCSSCQLGAGMRGDLVLGDYVDRTILDVTLDATRTAVVSRTVIYTHTHGVRTVETGPDGSIYFSDGTGIFRLSLGSATGSSRRRMPATINQKTPP